MSSLSQQAESRGVGSRVLSVLLLIVGASLGIVYFANQGSLLGVVFVALVSGFLVGWVLEPAQGARVRERGESL